MRKATNTRISATPGVGISIPAFREEGDLDNKEKFKIFQISIPAFREEGDGDGRGFSMPLTDFNPRLP